MLASEWPDKPSLRYIVHQWLRRESLCDGPAKCEHSDDNVSRCDGCPMDSLERSFQTGPGMMFKRALTLRKLIKLGISLTMDDITVDELEALGVIDDEVRDWESEEDEPDGR